MGKARELFGSGPEEILLSSGITVKVAPFPSGIWASLNSTALEKFPDPEPPKKEIKVVDGTELIDDLKDAGYLIGKADAERQRTELLGEAIVDLCIQIDLDEHEPLIKRLSKYSGEYPEDPDERRVKFLKEYVIRTKGDWEMVMVSATTQMMVSDPEVAARLKFFRREMEGAADSDDDAPGSAESERVEVSSEAEGT